MQMHQQKGVGLVEVMVAVLLLSVAVLGFSALQVRAVSATDESVTRTKALTLVRNLSEVMRAYPEAYVTVNGTEFTKATPTKTGALPTVQAVISSSATTTVTVDNKTIDISNSANGCLSSSSVIRSCSLNQLAARDALMFKKQANDEDLKVNVVTCPGTTTQAIQTQMCVIVAWNDTKALLDDVDTTACAKNNGVYKNGSQCLISEAY